MRLRGGRPHSAVFLDYFERVLRHTAHRGPDGVGAAHVGAGGARVRVVRSPLSRGDEDRVIHDIVGGVCGYDCACIVNFRGIPTTEAAGRLQPFQVGDVYVTHNGLLSNDRQLAERMGVTCGPDWVDSDIFGHLFFAGTARAKSIFSEVEGSFAVALYCAGERALVLARNYRGLYLCAWSLEDDLYLVWASEEEALQHRGGDTTCVVVRELPLNSYLVMPSGAATAAGVSGSSALDHLLERAVRHAPPPDEKSCVVVLSGGMDSTVCATWASRMYERVHLLHFLYGARAQAREVEAVNRIYDFLHIKYPHIEMAVRFIDLSFLRDLGGSTLTEHHRPVAQGEVGVETPHEWVPARNTVMIAMAAAYCDRHDIGAILLGNNMEEASVYRDNSQEFYDAMERALARGTISRPRMVMPVGNLMKHAIVRYGLELGAPLHLSWSCYHGGAVRCGTCGPDYMRMRAHQMCGARESVPYASYPDWFPAALRCPREE